MKMMGQPPKEINADDFSRGPWKESHGASSRELYNSHSGRYEPVPDRRGSMLSDHSGHHAGPHSGRQPAVAQRQSMDQPEPSGAFQSRTNQDGSFSRRRASSNVSGGSGTVFPRGGRGNDAQGQHPPDERGPRRPSFSGANEGRYANQHGNPPRPQAGINGRPSPSTAYATANDYVMPDLSNVHQVPDEDDVEYQKKLMKERIELARKRRQEEVAREEAAKKERIQKKLETLGPVPEKKPERRDGLSREESRPTQIHRREGAHSVEDQHASGSPKDPNSRKLSQNHEPNPAESWGGTSPRPDRLSAWGTDPNTIGRNVWGSPDNDRGLGNGTFNPDLGRIPGAGAPAIQPPNGPQPISLPATMQAAPIGSRASRYEAPNSTIASKWVAAVADKDKQLNAERLTERANKDRQLADRGLTAEEAQPVIKETWRQVHVPGDGSRQTMNAAHTPPMHGAVPGAVAGAGAGAWKAQRNDPRQQQQPNGPAPPAGVIGSGPPAKAQQAAKPPSQPANSAPQPANSSAQARASRFFPSRDARLDSPPNTNRPPSPSLPPPTMEGHPAYEGDAKRPHVSLPRAKPIVKLPPAAGHASHAHAYPSQQQPAWGGKGQPNGRGQQQRGHKSQRSGESSQEQWQDRFNNLLHTASPPKHTIAMDVSSRSGHEYNVPPSVATVMLPGSPRRQPRASSVPKTPESKPMAEECFEEQEMGSLPIIRLPNKASNGAWRSVVVQFKPLPKKFLIHASIMEPFRIADEHSGNSSIIRVHLPGMQAQKTVAIPHGSTSSRGGRGNASRPSPRHRGGGRGGKKEAPATAHGDSPPTNNRGNRGGYRGRGSENWHRNAAPTGPAQTALSA